MEGNNTHYYQKLITAIVKAREKKKLVNPLQPINPYGRPSVMTDAVLEKLRDGFLFGCTDEQAAAFAGIGVATIYNYQKENPEFLEQKNEWKQNPILKAKATVYNKLGETETAKWYLERKAKDEFSTRNEIVDKTAAQNKKEQELQEEMKGYGDVIEEFTKQAVAGNAPVQDKK